jgi:hypothetical protein
MDEHLNPSHQSKLCSLAQLTRKFECLSGYSNFLKTQNPQGSRLRAREKQKNHETSEQLKNLITVIRSKWRLRIYCRTYLKAFLKLRLTSINSFRRERLINMPLAPLSTNPLSIKQFSLHISARRIKFHARALSSLQFLTDGEITKQRRDEQAGRSYFIASSVIHITHL